MKCCGKEVSVIGDDDTQEYECEICHNKWVFRGMCEIAFSGTREEDKIKPKKKVTKKKK